MESKRTKNRITYCSTHSTSSGHTLWRTNIDYASRLRSKNTLTILAGCSKNKKSFGYTLIELVIVMGIMSIIMALLFPGLSVYSRGHSLTQGANMLKQAIDDARVAANSPPQDASATTTAYQVIFTINPAPPEVIGICPSGSGVPGLVLLANCKEKQITLPAGVTLYGIKQSNDDDYTHGTDVATSAAVFTIQYNFGDYSKAFYVNGNVFPISASNIIIRLENLQDGSTKDLVMNYLTGFMYVR